MTLSRRSLLAGAAALSASRAAAAFEMDVAVIGAGAAGIAAARTLIAGGRSVVVLEARDRIGGRAHTDRRLGIPFDAGAQYIHWAERNPWTRIAAELGIATEEETGGPPVVYANGLVLPEAERGRRRQAFARIGSLIAARARPDRSIAEATRGEPDLAAPTSGLTLLTLGEEPERVSAADYDQLWAGDDLVVPDGYGTLVERHGGTLPIRLRMPVRRIAWDGPGVAIETEAGDLRAGAAIVTVPVGVLQRERIAFTPALPAETRNSIAGLGMGAYTKIALALDPTKLAGFHIEDTLDLDSEGGTTSFEFRPFGRDLVLAYCGGDYARRLCEAGERAAVDHLTARLVSLFGARVREPITGGVLAGWWTDPFACGSYSIARPGHLAARETLRAPVGNRIWFAGEASAGGGAMTVGGAYLDGVRAAAEVAKTLPG